MFKDDEEVFITGQLTALVASSGARFKDHEMRFCGIFCRPLMIIIIMMMMRRNTFVDTVYGAITIIKWSYLLFTQITRAEKGANICHQLSIE